MLNRKIKNALNDSKAIKTAHLLSLDAFFLHEKMVLLRQMSWQGLFGHFKELKGTTVFWDIKLFTFSGRLSREVVSVLAVIVGNCSVWEDSSGRNMKCTMLNAENGENLVLSACYYGCFFLGYFVIAKS